MAKFRKDEVPYLEFFLINLLWGTSSFLNSEMIKIATHHLNNDTNFVTTFYVFFASSTLVLLFIRINVIFTHLTLILWNFIMHCIMLIFLFFPPKTIVTYYSFYAFLGYTSSINLMCSVNVASYTPSGLRGLVAGTAIMYFVSYLFADSLVYPVEEGMISYGSISFIIVRIVLSILSIRFYKTKVGNMFAWECADVMKHLTADGIGSWIVDGKAEDPRTDLVLKEYMPAFVDFAGFWEVVTEDWNDLVLLLVFIALVISTSFLSPVNTSATLVLSRYNLEKIYRIEVIANLLGAFAGLPQCRYFSHLYTIISAYLVHFVFLIIVFFGLNTYCFNIYASWMLMCCSTFICSFVGSWLLVVCLLQYTTKKLQVKCDGSKPKCCEFSRRKCFCERDIKKECCMNDEEKSGTDENIIWVGWSNHHAFRAWNTSDCLFCTSQNCDRMRCEGENECSSGGTAGGESSSQTSASAVGSSHTSETHYLLRNCTASCCPYCDLTVLLECVRISAVKNVGDTYSCTKCHKGDNDEKDEEEKEPRILKTVPLNLGSTTKYKLLTYSSCDELSKFMCCCPSKRDEHGKCTENAGAATATATTTTTSATTSTAGTTGTTTNHTTSHSICCHKSLQMDGKNPRCGRHFKLVDHEISRCCHYDLKIMLHYREVNTRFLIGQGAFPHKFDRVGGLMFNSLCCGENACTACKEAHCDVTKVPFKLCSSEITTGLNCDKCNCNGCTQDGKGTCSHIKIIPSGLPYHYKVKDIKRYGIVTTLLSSVLFFLLFRIIMGALFSLINASDDITLVAPMKQMKSVNGFELTTFNQPYKTDLDHARMLFPSFDGSEDELITMAIEEEVERIAIYAKLTKLVLGGLEAPSYDNWLEDKMSRPAKINGQSYSKLRYANHVSSFLYYALSEYIYRSSMAIIKYLDRHAQKWEVEFRDFERRTLKRLNMNTMHSTDLLKLGVHYANPKLQKKLDARQREIWERINEDAKRLSEDLVTLTELETQVKRASGENILSDKIELWEFRADLLKRWTDNRTIFLNWVSFINTMENVSIWKGYYMEIYQDGMKRKNVQSNESMEELMPIVQ